MQKATSFGHHDTNELHAPAGGMAPAGRDLRVAPSHSRDLSPDPGAAALDPKVTAGTSACAVICHEYVHPWLVPGLLVTGEARWHTLVGTHGCVLQARKEARRQEELRQREAELLEARKAYFEERKQVMLRNNCSCPSAEGVLGTAGALLAFSL